MNSLRNGGPHAWRVYLRPFEEGEPVVGLSMGVIYQHVAPIAKTQGSLDWADVAGRAAELEAANSIGVERDNALFRAMRLRSWFISKMGSRSGHRVLDKDIILAWANGGLSQSQQSAMEKATLFPENAAWAMASPHSDERKRLLDELRELRSIKDRLNVVKVLADSGELPSDSSLNKWLEIREQLP